jgi:threonine dehydrogenase-like Zn-dependent dehydrogenase
MKALQLVAPGEVELREIPIPTPGPDELLIRTGAATICTSDLADIRSNPFGIALPVVLGHEAAGTVNTVGADVRGFKPGDRIAAHPVHPCGECVECKRGLGHLCSNMSHFGIDRSGTFAEFFTVREDRARRIPDHVEFAPAALAEPICVSLEAVRRAKLAEGDSLLILGDGPFGLLMARIATRDPGIRTLIAGRHDFRLGFAHGAETLNIRDRPISNQELIALSGEAGFDAVIVAVPSTVAAMQGLELLRARGRLVIFAPIHEPVMLDLSLLLMKELEILGAVNDEELFDDAIDLLSDPTFGAGELVTQQFALEDFSMALALAEYGHDRAVKVAFCFSSSS